MSTSHVWATLLVSSAFVATMSHANARATFTPSGASTCSAVVTAEAPEPLGVNEERFGRKVADPHRKDGPPSVWEDEKGHAKKYQANGARYKIYRPEWSNDAQGNLIVDVKLVHERTGGDEHAMIRFEVSPSPEKRILKCAVETFDHDKPFVEASPEDRAGDSKKDKDEKGFEGRVKKVASAIGKGLKGVRKFSEGPVQGQFASEIEHVINHLGESIMLKSHIKG